MPSNASDAGRFAFLAGATGTQGTSLLTRFHGNFAGREGGGGGSGIVPGLAVLDMSTRVSAFIVTTFCFSAAGAAEFPLFAKSNCDPNGVFQFPGGGGGMAPYQFHALALPSASVRLARVELTCGQRSQRRPRRPMKSAEARRGPRDPREPARPARGPESRETSQKNPL